MKFPRATLQRLQPRNPPKDFDHASPQRLRCLIDLWRVTSKNKKETTLLGFVGRQKHSRKDRAKWIVWVQEPPSIMGQLYGWYEVVPKMILKAIAPMLRKEPKGSPKHLRRIIFFI